MADHVVDGGFSPPTDRNRLRAERDKAQQLLRELLEEVSDHMYAWPCDSSAALYKTAQRIREEMEG